ncbi:MAG: transposase [Okeania sp. SIO3B5]|nr:transposase [Okeania sp. SIO3B5]
MCSSCGFKGGKLDLQVREWECLNCGSKHDRDENAAINILVAPWAFGDEKRTWRQASD